jgi:hypothetical protein
LSFLNPWGLLFALFIPAIIILYLLKQQHEDLLISSTYLWEKALEDIRASRPWQRMKRNILLLLQVAAVLLLTLAVSRPFFNQAGTSEDYIVILDCSASMQARDVNPSRFSKALEDVERLVDGMIPGQRLTIIEATQQPGIIVNRTADKGVLKEALQTVKAGNGTADVQGAVSLANSLAEEMTSVSIYVYSDQEFTVSDERITTFVYNEAGENRGIANVSYTMRDDGPVVLSSIVNYGNDCTLTLECKVDDVTVGVKEVEIESEETASVYWNNLPSNGQVVEISIIEEDDLMVDNKGWAVLEVLSSARVLLVTGRNTFLEKAVKLRADVKLDKTTFEQAEGMEGYQLYIYDGYLPEELPRDGSILIFNPRSSEKEGTFLKVGEEFTPGSVRLRGSSSYQELVQYIHPEQFHIAKAVSVEPPAWTQTILDDGENPLFLAGELGNQRIAIFTFDIHNSDLPLKTDFPILIQNLMEWMLPRVVEQDVQKFSGEELSINPLPHAEQLYVITPSGEAIQAAPPFPVAPFNDTEEIGVYKLEQILGEEKVRSYFTVHIPVHEESNLRQSGEALEVESQGRNQEMIPTARREIWNILIWLVLALILAEWWVYQRGY